MQLRRGTDFVRLAIAKSHGGSVANSYQYAVNRWGERSTTVSLIKSAVAGAGTGSGEWGAELADTRQVAAEFLELVRPQTIIGKLQGLRRVPLKTPFIAQSGGAVAYWRGESRATPVSAGAFDRDSMKALGLGALMVFPDELLEDQSPEAELMIINDMVAAARELEDTAFISPTNAGVVDVSPAAVTHDAPTITSTGDIADDIEAAIGAFGGRLETSSWVLHPRLAVQMGLRAGGRGVAADLGARGGVLAGLPALCSESCQYDSDAGTIALVDAGGICLLDEGIETTRSNEVAIEMLNNPTGASDTPTAATSLVALWQNCSTALKVLRRINWTVARAGAVITITGAAYPAP